MQTQTSQYPTRYRITPIVFRDDEQAAAKKAQECGDYATFTDASKAAKLMDRRFPVRNAYGWIVVMNCGDGRSWI